MAGECLDLTAKNPLRTNDPDVPTRAWISEDIEDAKLYATELVDRALTYIQNITSVDTDPIDLSVQYESAAANFTPFEKPSDPDLPDLVYEANITFPGQPFIIPVNPSSVATVPTYDIGAFDVATIPQPELDTVSPPSDAPALDLPALPTAPTLTFPSVPSLTDLDLPDAVEIDLESLRAGFDELRASRPSLDPTAVDLLEIDVSGKYTDEYARVKGRSDNFLTENPASTTFFTRMSDILAGGTGMTATIEQQLFDRSVVREDRTAFLEKQNVLLDWSSRGFTLPGGAATARLQAVYQQNQNARQQINRDIYVQNAQFEIENMRFAVQQGLQLEQLYRQHFIAISDNALRSVEQIASIAISIYQAKVALFQAQVTAFQADVEAFRVAVQMELSKLEEYRARLEAERIRAEINVQNVQIYRAQLDGLLARVELFKAEVEAANSRIRNNELALNAYRVEVEAYTARIGANETKARVYEAQQRGEQNRAQAFESAVRGYGERVRAYSTQRDAEINTQRLIQESNRVTIERYQADVRKVQTELESEVARIRAGADVYQARASIYNAELGAESARVQASQRQFDLDVQQARSEAEIAIENARIAVQENQALIQIESENAKAVGQIGGQLAAAALSLMNLSANLSFGENRSDSTSCNTSYSASVGA